TAAFHTMHSKSATTNSLLRAHSSRTTSFCCHWARADFHKMYSFPVGGRALVPAASTTAGGALAAAAPAVATARRAVFAWLGFVHGQRAAAVVLAVEPGDGGLRLAVAAHLDETEALAPAGVPVADDLRAAHGSVRG